MEYQPQYIIVHHSATDSPNPQFDSINSWHKARSFPPSDLGYFVGYHRVIEKDGTIQIARGDLERDSDALGHNFDSLSVCLVGNFSVSEPTPKQVSALGALLAEWTEKYKIHPTLIFPHRHFGSTSCYGSKLENTWATLVCLSHLATQKKSWL